MWASSLMLAADWKRYFSQAETVAERLEGGKKVYDVELTSDSGAKVTLSFDAESGLQLGQKFEQVTPMGKMPVSVEIEDYREVDGIKIPFKQITDASLAKATQEITEVEFNPEVDTSTFAMPTGGAEVVREQDLEPGKPVP
jgi:outer membrane lipoprotein-sorting protein